MNAPDAEPGGVRGSEREVDRDMQRFSAREFCRRYNGQQVTIGSMRIHIRYEPTPSLPRDRPEAQLSI